jgi:hypothetical protein
MGRSDTPPLVTPSDVWVRLVAASMTVAMCGPVLVAGLGGELLALLCFTRLRRYWSAYGQHQGSFAAICGCLRPLP